MRAVHDGVIWTEGVATEDATDSVPEAKYLEYPLLDRQIGTEASLRLHNPRHEEVSLFSSEPEEFAFRPRNWVNMLGHRNIRDSFSVNKLGVHRLHRTQAHVPTHNISVEEVDKHRNRLLVKVFDDSIPAEEPLDPERDAYRAFTMANELMASEFGLKYQGEDHQ